MNERIKELAFQAGLSDEVRDGSRNQELEKFAELIAKQILTYAEDGDLDFMKFMIKKDFGVE